ncbi:hypothetical protein DTL21_25190 [Bremerella cremea]|uniref:Uncharacterized protein n=1 Tax=Blastopirellula marina TaxID=124 RepID=A0A2S8FB40_9BACT|nr:hypothetical protein C5Y83_25145 [Blastopirellula marina]RCS42671.1 hypothetical protein DTL21_25190 [Bremerella cremea]
MRYSPTSDDELVSDKQIRAARATYQGLFAMIAIAFTTDKCTTQPTQLSSKVSLATKRTTFILPA